MSKKKKCYCIICDLYIFHRRFSYAGQVTVHFDILRMIIQYKFMWENNIVSEFLKNRLE